ncbi:MAG: hypothetical protein NPIRA05_13200 [Nitrospirales bacterium]|nr:MAG: hypothetical protein NPIRA05_13200 [Nitrospirales bacterium]
MQGVTVSWRRISIGITILGMISLTAFHLIGGTIDAQGFLREPFALLPIGYALLVIGGIGALISFLFHAKRQNRIRRNNHM